MFYDQPLGPHSTLVPGRSSNIHCRLNTTVSRGWTVDGGEPKHKHTYILTTSFKYFSCLGNWTCDAAIDAKGWGITNISSWLFTSKYATSQPKHAFGSPQQHHDRCAEVQTNTVLKRCLGPASCVIFHTGLCESWHAMLTTFGIRVLVKNITRIGQNTTGC